MSELVASFSNTYARLPERFFVRLDPTPVADPRLLLFNRPLAAELGLHVAAAGDAELAAIFSGNRVPPLAEPLSMAYAGHQFGGFVPQLGDGRAILLGEVIDGAGRRRDIQLKGAGLTPFSRQGDGRAALGPVLREYVLSEALHALGVPTTRALAAVATGESVWRDTRLPGAVLTRVAASHVRVGTFQFFAARRDAPALRLLADYVIDRHYPVARLAANPYLALLRAVAQRQAALVARWESIGFVHGVMNTDNMAVSGETIDFGPCAFVEEYDPAAVFSSIDVAGRYAFGNQVHAARWNLARFAETLLELLDAQSARAIELAQEVVEEFPAWYESEWLAAMRAKLGLASAQEGDLALARALLGAMHEQHADFTLSFRRLAAAQNHAAGAGGPRELFARPEAFDEWAAAWRRRLACESATSDERARAMGAVNPACIPRNHLVERALDAAVRSEDYTPVRELLEAVVRPYAERDALDEYARPAPPDERVLRTFCGT